LALINIVHKHSVAALKRMKDKTLQGDVEEDADLECIEADRIGLLILKHWGLSRVQAGGEIQIFKGHWRSPGEIVDLHFLTSNTTFE
jgi:hypothetical protein